jgi:hypothetical protein
MIKFNLERSIRSIRGHVTAKALVHALPKTTGDSFLMNYDSLFQTVFKHNETDVINYVVLAAKRDYRYAKSVGDYSLDADFCYLSREELDRNKLLTYDNNRIYFLYEECRDKTT